ncbi:MAG: sugar transferase [Hyphomicrobiaceae bacterium]|nr:sugar transferase [Hyphomicrobiaceae bacterium]
MRIGYDLEAGHGERLNSRAFHNEWQRSVRRWVTRSSDVVLAILLALVLSPLIASALALSFLSFRAMPVVWRERDGTRHARVRVYGIRTEKPPREADGKAIPLRNRQTPVSRLLKSTRLDRCPEILSILRGELSFFGSVSDPLTHAVRRSERC